LREVARTSAPLPDYARQRATASDVALSRRNRHWCAAIESGTLTTVDDVSKAVARLVTDNAQGELSPLEIGLHALPNSD
jgi:hypothetical protein